jgi:PhnB protein
MVLASTNHVKEEPMATKVKPIPEGYHTLTPYLTVRGASDAISFYKKAFGAEEIVRMPMPDGRVGHAELQIGDSRLMMADEMPEMGDAVTQSPRTLGGATAGMCLYVPDVDALFQRAVDAGAKAKRPLTNQFYGDRSAVVEDPFGHLWTLATHVEDVSPEEMKKRMAALEQKK